MSLQKPRFLLVSFSRSDYLPLETKPLRLLHLKCLGKSDHYPLAWLYQNWLAPPPRDLLLSQHENPKESIFDQDDDDDDESVSQSVGGRRRLLADCWQLDLTFIICLEQYSSVRPEKEREILTPNRLKGSSAVAICFHAPPVGRLWTCVYQEFIGGDISSSNTTLAPLDEPTDVFPNDLILQPLPCLSEYKSCASELPAGNFALCLGIIATNNLVVDEAD